MEETAIRKMLVDRLGDAGCRIVVAGDLAGACERIRLQRFDFILCDYWMREIDGIAFFMHIKDLRQPAVKVLMTGYPIRATSSDLRSAGIDHIVSTSEAILYMNRLKGRPVSTVERQPEGMCHICEKGIFPYSGHSMKSPEGPLPGR